MKFFEKLLVFILTLFTICMSIFFIAISTKFIGLQYISTSLSVFYGKWETGVFGFLLLIFSVYIFVYVLKPQRFPEAIVSDGELGKVCITLGAVESLVQKVIRDIEEVMESKISIKKKENGVSIILKITVNYDVTIPDLTSEMQTAIKNYVEATAGISVISVRIVVSDVSNQKTKVVK